MGLVFEVLVPVDGVVLVEGLVVLELLEGMLVLFLFTVGLLEHFILSASFFGTTNIIKCIYWSVSPLLGTPGTNAK